jgi:hypothetical protein
VYKIKVAKPLLANNVAKFRIFVKKMTTVITGTKSNEAKRLVEQLKPIDYVKVVNVRS